MRNKSPQAVQQPHRRSPRNSIVTPSKALPVPIVQDQDDGKSDKPTKNLIEKDGNLCPEMVNNGGTVMDSDSLGLGTCIRCDNRDGQLLVCGGNDCLISVHEKCMGCGPKFDDLGKFRCPLCEQKVAAALVMERRRRVMEAKKALSVFLEGTAVVGVAECVGDGVDVESHSRKKKKGNGGLSCLIPDSDKTVLENEIPTNGFVDDVGTSGEGNREKVETGRLETVEEEKGEEDIAEETGKMVSEKNGKMGDGEEEVQPEASDEIENDDNEVPETETVVKRPKRFKQRAGRMENRVEKPFLLRKAVAKKNASASYEKANTRSKSQAASTNLSATFVLEKRKRLHWTDDEEEMLRKYVEKYSDGASNVPWRKILDEGSAVFHNTRVPGDLRDKWRKMIRTEGKQPKRR